MLSHDLAQDRLLVRPFLKILSGIARANQCESVSFRAPKILSFYLRLEVFPLLNMSTHKKPLTEATPVASIATAFGQNVKVHAMV